MKTTALVTATDIIMHELCTIFNDFGMSIQDAEEFHILLSTKEENEGILVGDAVHIAFKKEDETHSFQQLAKEFLKGAVAHYFNTLPPSVHDALQHDNGGMMADKWGNLALETYYPKGESI